MGTHLATSDEHDVSRSAPESPSTVYMNTKEQCIRPVPGEPGAGQDETPAETDLAEKAEFKEGGYGWLVPIYLP